MFSVAELRADLPNLPDPVISTVRYDAKGKRVSVIDVFRVMTGCTRGHASEDLTAIISLRPDICKVTGGATNVAGEIGHFKFPGQGQRDTPVCDANTLSLLYAHS